jgi:D-inositol-3-phosphate glycosyltransferase
VVASDVSGLRSVARDGVTGFLVAGDDPADYEDRIARLLDDPELARQMGRRGQLLAQRFSWSRTADRLAELFSSLADRKAASTVNGGHVHSRVQAGMRHE